MIRTTRSSHEEKWRQIVGIVGPFSREKRLQSR